MIDALGLRITFDGAEAPRYVSKQSERLTLHFTRRAERAAARRTTAVRRAGTGAAREAEAERDSMVLRILSGRTARESG